MRGIIDNVTASASTKLGKRRTKIAQWFSLFPLELGARSCRDKVV